MNTSAWTEVCRFYEFKTPEVAEEFKEACNANKHFFAYILIMGALAKKKIFITDVWRDDKSSTHFWKRAFDGRVYHPERDGRDGKGYTMTKQDWLSLKESLAEVAQYMGGENELIHLHGEGMNYHAHCQIGVFTDKPLEL